MRAEQQLGPARRIGIGQILLCQAPEGANSGGRVVRRGQREAGRRLDLGQVQTNGRPIETTPVPPDTPKWGAKWKAAVRDNYRSLLKGGSIHGGFYSYRDVYLDLDPTYKDRFDRPR